MSNRDRCEHGRRDQSTNMNRSPSYSVSAVRALTAVALMCAALTASAHRCSTGLRPAHIRDAGRRRPRTDRRGQGREPERTAGHLRSRRTGAGRFHRCRDRPPESRGLHGRRRRRVAAGDQGTNRKVLIVGNEGWPFPVPLAKIAARWRFDTAAGKEEVLARRIGRNELAAIGTCRTYVGAQRHYAEQGHDGKPAGLFATTFTQRSGQAERPVLAGRSTSATESAR